MSTLGPTSWVATFATSMTTETERFYSYENAVAWIAERQADALQGVTPLGIRAAGLQFQSSIRYEGDGA